MVTKTQEMQHNTKKTKKYNNLQRHKRKHEITKKFAKMRTNNTRQYKIEKHETKSTNTKKYENIKSMKKT